MSLSLAIAINVIADLALIGVLALVMSRAKLLTPHASATPARTIPVAAARTTRPARQAARTRSSVLTAQA
jgi:hypothetical protein